MTRHLHLGIESISKHTFAIHMPVGQFTTDVHLHSRHQLLYAEGGVLHFFAENQRWILPARHAAWIPAGLKHQVQSPSPHLYLRTIYIRDMNEGDMFPDQLTIFPVTPLAREMILYTQRWHHEHPVTQPETIFFDAICSLISEWCNAAMILILPMTQHALLAKITTYMVANLEKELTLKRAGSVFGISSRTMMRLFRIHLDMTFHEYLRMARMIAALELLSSPDVTITEIALRVGYQSMSSFSQTFKSYVGKSPSQFRNEIKSSKE